MRDTFGTLYQKDQNKAWYAQPPSSVWTRLTGAPASLHGACFRKHTAHARGRRSRLCAVIWEAEWTHCWSLQLFDMRFTLSSILKMKKLKHREVKKHVRSVKSAVAEIPAQATWAEQLYIALLHSTSQNLSPRPQLYKKFFCLTLSSEIVELGR